MAKTAKYRTGGVDKAYFYFAKLNSTPDGYDLLQSDLSTPVADYEDYGLFLDRTQKVDFQPQNDGTCNVTWTSDQRDENLLTFLKTAAEATSDDSGSSEEERTYIDGETAGGSSAISADDVLVVAVGYSALGTDSKHQVMVTVGKVAMESFGTSMEPNKVNMTNLKITGVKLDYDLTVTTLIDTTIVNLAADTPAIDVSTGRMFEILSYAAAS